MEPPISEARPDCGVRLQARTWPGSAGGVGTSSMTMPARYWCMACGFHGPPVDRRSGRLIAAALCDDGHVLLGELVARPDGARDPYQRIRGPRLRVRPLLRLKLTGEWTVAEDVGNPP